MSVEIKICIEGPEDPQADMQEDEKEKAAKLAALKKILGSSKMSTDSLASFIELLTSGEDD